MSTLPIPQLAQVRRHDCAHGAPSSRAQRRPVAYLSAGLWRPAYSFGQGSTALRRGRRPHRGPLVSAARDLSRPRRLGANERCAGVSVEGASTMACSTTVFSGFRLSVESVQGCRPRHTLYFCSMLHSSPAAGFKDFHLPSTHLVVHAWRQRPTRSIQRLGSHTALHRASDLQQAKQPASAQRALESPTSRASGLVRVHGRDNGVQDAALLRWHRGCASRSLW